MESRVNTLMKVSISIIGKSENVFRISIDMMPQLPPEPSRQEVFKDLMMNFILDQEEKVKQLEEYMGVIGSDFLQLSLVVVEKLKEEIRIKKNKFMKIKKSREKASFHTPKFVSPKALCVKHVRTIFPSPPTVRDSTFGFKPGTKNNQNVKSRHDVKNANPQSSPQVLPSFKEYTSPVTYPEEVEETIRIPMEVEPLDHMKLEDLGLNTCSHDLFISYREIPSFDEPKPHPHPVPNCLPLDISLGDKRGLEPQKPHSPNSFRMKVVENLTIHTPPSPHVASFHLMNLYCYYHPCLDDPKKHYGFKQGLL
nr:ribonuclease H-like domain-containing protein [Tanacetum cinerariifolium]